MAEYKLEYFDARGIAEPIRWIFAYKGIPFEDRRIHIDDWSEHIQNYVWGRLPIMFDNGVEFAQSASIARYLAKKLNLAGKGDFEAYLCDQYVDHVFDFLKDFGPWYLTPNKVEREEHRRRIRKDILPQFLANFERVMKLRPGKYLLGDDVSYADFYVANFLEIVDKGPHFAGPNLLDGYPDLTQHRSDVLSLPGIKEIIAKHPNASYCCDQCQKIMLKEHCG